MLDPERPFQEGATQRGRRGRLIAVLTAALVLAAGVSIVLVSQRSQAAAKLSGQKTSVQAGGGNQGTASSPRSTGKASPGPQASPSAAPVTITSVTPANHQHAVNGAGAITVRFSTALAASTARPRLSPSIAGSWKASGSTLTFTPAVGYPEHTTVTLTVPGGSSGVSASDGARLARSAQYRFTTGAYSTLRLQQLLAQLGYLPLTWTATGTAPAASDARAQLAAAYSPPRGSFGWQSGYPSELHAFWSPGKGGLIQDGAVRAFEWSQKISMDGVAGPSVWRHLLTAIGKGQRNTHGYTYALASKASPETLTIWHNGHVVLHSLANTGIAAAPTADGTYPVYLRYYFQIMRGTNPNGTKYADPVHYISYFNGGDAVHYFVRSGYGWPQSLGCVELPLSSAKTAWKYLTYGSLVTVK